MLRPALDCRFKPVETSMHPELPLDSSMSCLLQQTCWRQRDEYPTFDSIAPHFVHYIHTPCLLWCTTDSIEKNHSACYRDLCCQVALFLPAPNLLNLLSTHHEFTKCGRNECLRQEMLAHDAHSDILSKGQQAADSPAQQADTCDDTISSQRSVYALRSCLLFIFGALVSCQ